MSNKYYLHRISHEGNVSYGLIKNKILTIGWGVFSDTDIMNAARESGYPRFDVITKQKGQEKNRSRWNMWYFAQMDKDDTVVVPMYGGLFSAYKVCEKARPISDLESQLTSFKGAWDNHEIIWKDHMLYDLTDERSIDLGFYIIVEPIFENVPRRYVDGVFESRMKIRNTTADITDIKKNVEEGIEACKNNTPITLYAKAIDNLVKDMKKSIVETLNPNKFEYLIKWYINKCGATSAWIPAKNEPGKKDGADADIVAEFRNLKHILYIQAKHHRGVTPRWAVDQINEYFSQMSEGDPDYSYAKWVISTCDNFDEDAIEAAKKYNVRLINGDEFSRMLIDVGLLNLDDAFQ